MDVVNAPNLEEFQIGERTLWVSCIFLSLNHVWHDIGIVLRKPNQMKKPLLFLTLALMAVEGMAQNILDNKVTFRYTQLPLVKITDNSRTYALDVQMSYKQRNDDSLKAWEQARQNYLVTLEGYMNAYEQQIAQIDRQHLNNMVQWEKQVAAGNTAAQPPVKPPYPGMNPPLRPKKPFILQDVVPASVTAAIRPEGIMLNAGSGTKITLVFDGFEKGPVRLDKTGQAPAEKYSYIMQYRHPVTMQIEVPGRGMVYNQRLPDTEPFRSMRTKEFPTKAELELWWFDNELVTWDERQRVAINEICSQITAYLTQNHGFPVITRRIELYSAKQKGVDYTDVQKAYGIMESGLLMLAFPDKVGQAQAKMQEALGVYNQILQESNPNDRKARVDANVTSACLVNMTEAYIWLNDYANAEMCANRVINIGVNKYVRDARAHLEFIRFQQMRWNANQ
jgi:hypothetical protein